MSQNSSLYSRYVQSLSPEMLCYQLQDTIKAAGEVDPNDKETLAEMQELIKCQIIRLKNIVHITQILDSLFKSESPKLPIHPKSGLPNIEACCVALMEQAHVSSIIKSFAMLLIDIDYAQILFKKYSSEAISYKLTCQIAQIIDENLCYQHLVFSLRYHMLAIIVYVENDNELLKIGNSLISMISEQKFNIEINNDDNEKVQTTLSIGGCLYYNYDNVDFKKWLSICEECIAQAQNNGGNRVCIRKANEQNMLSAIIKIEKPNQNQNGNENENKNENKNDEANEKVNNNEIKSDTIDNNNNNNNNNTDNDNKSSFALLAGPKLTPAQIHTSLKLYDKIKSLKNSERDKMAALAITRAYKKQGADYNYQNPKDKNNNLLMLACIQKLDIIIKYFCLKISNEINFEMQNKDENNALMLSIYNNLPDDIIKLIANNTKDKSKINNEGKTAFAIAQEKGRDNLKDFIGI